MKGGGVVRKNLKQRATTWSEAEKKSITSIKDLNANQWHQVNYAQTMARYVHKKSAMARMEERMKNALRFL